MVCGSSSNQHVLESLAQGIFTNARSEMKMELPITKLKCWRSCHYPNRQYTQVTLALGSYNKDITRSRWSHTNSKSENAQSQTFATGPKTCLIRESKQIGIDQLSKYCSKPFSLKREDVKTETFMVYLLCLGMCVVL